LFYHLARRVRELEGEDFYEDFWKSNAVGHKECHRLQEKYGFRAVYFSSSEGLRDYEGVMSEDVLDKVPIRQMNDYAITKWVNELQGAEL
jgi:dTDP-glucose 4,6-dehydratase